MFDSLNKLEFQNILTMVQNLAGSKAGKILINKQLPATDRKTAFELSEETFHAAKLIHLSIEPRLSRLQDLINAVTLLRDGAIALEPVDLRMVGFALLDMSDFKNQLSTSEEDTSGILDSLFQEILNLDTSAKYFIKITTSDGELSPNASPELKRITGRINSLRTSLAAKLSKISSRLKANGVLRDSPVSIRAGRYVLPVIATKRSSVKGLIHDRSESGVTLFVEPAELVESGNELQEAVFDLQQERRRILREATSTLREELPEIEKGISVFSKLDFCFARGRYHLKNNTVFPDEGIMNLIDLAHPLLASEMVVRSTVKLDKNWKVLVISGPNAGGKSVLLKAISLASICSRTGLGAHVGVGSTMPFFKSVMVSMGDNQSIAMHLSTYSARLSEQKSILEAAEIETLAIIDEPSAGTDPVTGAALATVFLEAVAARGVKTIVSTHMGQLKLLAEQKEGFCNGSMSFNTNTLTPGYKFVSNIPGASCTLEAAAIAGFPKDIIKEASELSGDSFSLDSLVISLRQLEEEKQYEIEKLQQQRKYEKKTRKHLEKQLKKAQKDFEDELESAELQKETALKEIRSKADSLMVSIANSKTSEERKTARKEVGKIVKQNTKAVLSKSSLPSKHHRSDDSCMEIEIGDSVETPGWSDAGIVEKIGRTTAMIRFGSVLIKKDISSLTKLAKPEQENTSLFEYSAIEEKPEVMLLGMTVDEAIAELDIKLDNCLVVSIKRIRIVHGKGRLMKGITDWLRHDRRVKSLSIAPPSEGGTGASIAILKG